MRLKTSGFTLIEALISIGAIVVASAAILSALLASSHLKDFSENFTVAINACQEQLENIRYDYKDESSPNRITFSQLLAGTRNGTIFLTNLDNFNGAIITVDPYAGVTALAGRMVQVTARAAFRVGNRVIGGDDSLNPAADTPCQVSITIVNED